MEDLDFKYKYLIHVKGKTSGKLCSYNIKADTDLDALKYAREFSSDDFPEDEIRFMEILEKEEI